MDFSTLRGRLLFSLLRSRMRNGELTERGLAHQTGVSQPHIHNILKGHRELTVQVADRILKQLGLTILDLIERDEVVGHMCRMVILTLDQRTTPPVAVSRPHRDKFPGPRAPSDPN